MAELGTQVLPQLYERELEYLVREEFARTPEDILWRRSKLGLHLMKFDTSPLERWLEGQDFTAPALTARPAGAP
jgi:glycerol-3-phosphate dehydrogenase